MEMVSFFKYATFFSFREEFQPVLASRAALRSLFECIKGLDSDHDIPLKEYYLNRKEE